VLVKKSHLVSLGRMGRGGRRLSPNIRSSNPKLESRNQKEVPIANPASIASWRLGVKWGRRGGTGLRWEASAVAGKLWRDKPARQASTMKGGTVKI